MRIRFGTLLTFVTLGLTIVPCYQAASQSYPARQITIVIPFPAVGNLEIVARPLAERLSVSLGQPVIIENRPGGAGGTVGTKAVANAKPDGYTLLLTPAAPLVTAPAIYKNLGYDPSRDFVPVATLFSVPHMLVVHPALPVDSMERLVSYAKGNPGKVSYASPGFGTQPHLLAELFRLTTGANIVHVPYKGATSAVTDILAGQVQMYFDSVALFLPHIQAGKLRALAVAYSGAAGGAQNIAVFDELWGYTSERSHRLWDEMVPVPTRKIACRLTATYAGFSDDSALLETLYKRGRALPLVGPDLHAGDGLLMFWSHEPIAPWQTAAWIEQMRRSLRPNQFLRMIENRLVTSESTITDMAGWARCNAAKVRPLAESR